MSFTVRHQVLATETIASQSGRYMGWPTVARLQNGELNVVFSGDRDEHICPWGKTQLIRSLDEGKSWSEPETINNSLIDDRDAGIIQSAKGTLLLSWFTSYAFINGDIEWMYGKEKTTRFRRNWQSHIDLVKKQVKNRKSQSLIRRSTDFGKTWEPAVELEVSCPHGPSELFNGRILYVGKKSIKEMPVFESCDDGRTWQRLSEIELPGDDAGNFWEPHLVQAVNGDLITMIRHTPDDENNFLYQSVSHNNGKSWTLPRKTKIWGSPPHLTRLKNGLILLVYSCRRDDGGQFAVVSRDHGKSWSEPIRLSHAPNLDHGYPASAELSDGSIYTVFYEIDQLPEKPVIKGVKWRLL